MATLCELRLAWPAGDLAENTPLFHHKPTHRPNLIPKFFNRFKAVIDLMISRNSYNLIGMGALRHMQVFSAVLIGDLKLAPLLPTRLAGRPKIPLRSFCWEFRALPKEFYAGRSHGPRVHIKILFTLSIFSSAKTRLYSICIKYPILRTPDS